MPNEERESRRHRGNRTPPSRSRSPRSKSGSPPTQAPPRIRAPSPAPVYRSKSPEDRDNRSRRTDRDDVKHFSNYYKSRFGSQSPEEYQNLRVTNIDPNVSNDDLRDSLEKMNRYGDLQVKIVNQRDPYGRIAYVNFERAGDAKDARKGHLNKLVTALGRGVAIDPTGVVRDQEGRAVNSNNSGPPMSRDSYNDRGRRGGYGNDRDDYRGRGGDRHHDEKSYRSERR